MVRRSPGPFDSAKRRLGRAKHHVRTLDKRFQTFFKKKPYVGVIESHTDGVSQAHKVKLRRKLPKDVTDIAYEALEGLRSALDQTAYAVAIICGTPRPELVHFPVTDDPAQFENTISGRCKDFPPEIVALFRSFQAYPGGNDLIVALNRVRRQGFHRLLTPVGSAVYRVSGSSGMLRGGPVPEYPTYIPAPIVWDSTKDEMVYGVVGPGGEFNYKIDFSFIVAFGEIEGLAGAPVVPALRELVREVERIVIATESEARRIGLF
jgi:hypothetical protein